MNEFLYTSNDSKLNTKSNIVEFEEKNNQNETNIIKKNEPSMEINYYYSSLYNIEEVVKHKIEFS